MADTRLYFDAVEHYENGATFVVLDDGRLSVSVSDVQAVDSYNQDFECTVRLTKTQAVKLRNWLNTNFP